MTNNPMMEVDRLLRIIADIERVANMAIKYEPVICHSFGQSILGLVKLARREGLANDEEPE